MGGGPGILVKVAGDAGAAFLLVLLYWSSWFLISSAFWELLGSLTH